MFGSDSPCSKYNIADGMRQMFDPFERVARAHHICPCCERPFSPYEEDEFVKKVSGLKHRTRQILICASDVPEVFFDVPF